VKVKLGKLDVGSENERVKRFERRAAKSGEERRGGGRRIESATRRPIALRRGAGRRKRVKFFKEEKNFEKK